MTAHMGIQLLTTALSIYVLVQSILLRTVPKSVYFMPLALSALLYSFGSILELSSSTTGGFITAQLLQYCGICTAPVLFYLFVRDYADRPVTGWYRICLLFTFPAVSLFAYYANLQSPLFYQGMTADPVLQSAAQVSTFSYLSFAYSLAFVLLSGIEMILHRPANPASQNRVYFVSIAFFMALCLFALSFNNGILSSPTEPGSLIFSLCLVLLAYYLRHHPQDWAPFSREMVMEQIDDAFLLVDGNNCLLDANTVAKHYFPCLQDFEVGLSASEVPGFPMEILKEGNTKWNFPLNIHGDNYLLRAIKNEICFHGKTICYSIIIQNMTEYLQLFNELETQATTDSLTTLPNRSAFFTQASRDFALHQRLGHSASLMMLDIDYFKDVNDVFGHPVGDRVLREFADILKGRLRQTDIGGRYGGEEFCIFLPATGLRGAFIIAEEIRQLAEDHVYHANGKRFHITVSIGLVELDLERHHTLEDMITDADRALYTAKRSGRNKVVEHLSMPPLEMARNSSQASYPYSY